MPGAKTKAFNKISQLLAASATVMELENTSCPLCGSRNHRLIFKRRDHTHRVSDEQFNIVKCQECGLVFINPRPSEQGIHEYYTNEFYNVHLTPEQLLQETEDRNHAKLKFLQHLKPGRLLDIGCQKGEFLHKARELGWDVQGVEFSTKPPNLFNLPIHYGALEDAPYHDGSFDAITVWAVLEHVHDPLKMMGHVRRLLKPDGRAYILVPNFNSIPGRLMRHDDVPRHLVMFTPSTFKEMAAKAGLISTRFVFSDDVFSGSTRGALNFAYKRLWGESMDDILAQNRDPDRWNEFSSFVNGRESEVLAKIDRWDIALSPYLDKIVNFLNLGFIMTVEVTPDPTWTLTP